VDFRSLYSLKHTFSALLYSTCLASLKVPEADSIIPKYLYLLTHSITSLPSLKFSVISLPVLLKITTLVFFILTFKHQSLQYWCIYIYTLHEGIILLFLPNTNLVFCVIPVF